MGKMKIHELAKEIDKTSKDIIAVAQEFDKNGIEIKEISGNTFFAKMLIINDPTRVKLATTYPWKEYGLELEKLVNQKNSIAGVNGGLYLSTGNKGGQPLGVVVAN